MKIIKAFIAGITIPSIILPFLLCLSLSLGKPQILTLPFLHFIPLIWGIWNMLYFIFFKRVFPENVDTRLWMTGALLGLLIAIYGVFKLEVPEIIGIPEKLSYVFLILGPVLYGILWRYLLKPLNELVGLQN